MSTGHIKLWWSVKKQPDSFNIYHSLSPFSPTNLPVPVATGLAATTREFRHLDQEHQYDHYYRIASVKNGRLYVSRGVLVRKKPIIPDIDPIDYIDFYAAISQSEITLSARDYIASLSDDAQLYLTLTNDDKTISKTHTFNAKAFKLRFRLGDGVPRENIFVNGNTLFDNSELGYTTRGTFSWGFGYTNDDLYSTSFGGYEVDPPFPPAVGHASLEIQSNVPFHVVRTDSANDVANIFDLSDGLFRHWDAKGTRWDKNL